MALEHRSSAEDLKRDIGQTESHDEKRDDSLSSNVQVSVDPQLEKKLVRKLDMVIMPLTCALYLFAYLDRSNLGPPPHTLYTSKYLTCNTYV